MNTARHLQWSSAELSHVGMVREVNEDACLALPELGLWAVADGMGGHEAGDVASRLVVDTLRQVTPPSDWDSFIASVKTCLWEANRQLRIESAHRYQHRTIGSTVVVMLAHQDQGACLWVGDSRIYRLQNGSLQQLTRDHSHVQELVDYGLLTPEQAQDHPMSNMITRAVGSSPDLDIDVCTFALQPGDAFLLCSDGLNKVVRDKEIASLLADPDCQRSVQALTQVALDRGANDNVTTVVVRIRTLPEENTETVSL